MTLAMETVIVINETYTTIQIKKASLEMEDVLALEEILKSQLEAGNQYQIVQMKEVENISAPAIAHLANLHEFFYNQGYSLVFAEPSENVHRRIKQEQIHLVINLCPTMDEAIDIISMEILERDLMKEDECN